MMYLFSVSSRDSGLPDGVLYDKGKFSAYVDYDNCVNNGTDYIVVKQTVRIVEKRTKDLYDHMKKG